MPTITEIVKSHRPDFAPYEDLCEALSFPQLFPVT